MLDATSDEQFAQRTVADLGERGVGHQTADAVAAEGRQE
jgi:hypothetical protein